MLRKWLLTTVITGGLVATSCGGGVYAQSGKLLHPNSGWAISKLAAAGTGAEPYCALARRFNGNIILTVARNSSDESSVAIDFQRQALENGRSYQVTLDPGFKQHRSYNVRPVSGKAMVVRLGQDYAFHDALNRSGKLAIDISGEVYSFHLPDFADGQTQLAGCLAGLVQPAAGKARSASHAEPVPMPAQPPAQVSQAPRTPVQNTYSGQRLAQADVKPVPAPAPKVSSASSASEGELLSLREENTRLRNALTRERRIYEDRFMKEGQSSSQVAELSERLQILERENEDLRQQLTYKPAEPVSKPQETTSVLACAPNEDDKTEIAQKSVAMASMASEMKMLREENERLKKEIIQQQAEMALLQQKIVTASAENTSPVKEEAAAQDAIIERLTGRVKVLEEENRAMKEAQRADAGGSSVSLAQLRSLEEQLRYTQQDRDKLSREIDSIRNGKGDELMNISSSNWNLEQATQRYNEAEKEIRRLSRQLSEQRAQCAGEKKELEYMLFDPEVAREQQISKLITLENELDDVSRRYEEQAGLHEAELQRVKTKAATGSQEKLASLKAKMAALSKEKQFVEDERDALMREKSTAEEGKLALLKAKEEAENKVAALTREKQQADARLASVIQEKEQLAASKEALLAEKAQVKQKLSALSQQKQTVEQGRVALLQESREVKSEVQILEQEKIAMKAELEALEQNKGVLEAEMQALDAEKATLEQGRITLLQEKREVEAERDSLVQKVASLEASLASIQTASGAKAESTQRVAAVRDVTPAPTPQPVHAEPIVMSSSSSYKSGKVSYKDDRSSAADYEHNEKTALYGDDTKQIAPARQTTTHVANDVNSSVGNAIQETSYVAMASNVTFSASQDIARLLGQAQIPVQGSVKKESVAGGQAFSWDTGSLFGSAEQKPMENVNAFDNMAQSYIANTKSRCGGEFAAIPVMSEQKGDMRISTYDIACITDNGGASASILFYNQSGLFNTYAHETGMDSMDLAMDARDKLLNVLLSGYIAMR